MKAVWAGLDADSKRWLLGQSPRNGNDDQIKQHQAHEHVPPSGGTDTT